MAGTVFLRTNKFEVKLEGITFKSKDFETICATNLLFPENKIRFTQNPVVGIDVMRHPRDPSIVLLLLCFGVGCVILRFTSGEPLPEPIFKFLTDERIRFVGFGVPEKKDLFPFEALGLAKNKVDVGYVAAKILDDPKYKNLTLAELAKKVLGVSKMMGLTASSSFERHEQIKCAICQLFLSTVIAMTLLRAHGKKNVVGETLPKVKDCAKNKKFIKRNLTTNAGPKKKKFIDAAKMIACLKGMDTLSLLNEEFFNKEKKINEKAKVQDCAFWDIFYDATKGAKKGDTKNTELVENQSENPNVFGDYHGKIAKNSKEKENPKVVDTNKDIIDDYLRTNGIFGDESVRPKSKKEEDVAAQVKEPSCDEDPCKGVKSESIQIKNMEDSPKKPLKGILKCPSTGLENYGFALSKPNSPPSSSKLENGNCCPNLRRANSKGCNVTFKH